MNEFNSVEISLAVAKMNFEALTLSEERYHQMLEDADSLEDFAATVLSGSNGWKIMEHLRLNEELHVFVIRTISEWKDGCALDAIIGINQLDIDQSTVEYFYCNEKAAKEFVIEQLTNCGMF